MRTLMVTVGSTPQVVTETAWALISEGWVPERIILLTTREGERIFTQGTPPLVGKDGRLFALYAACAPEAALPEVEILLPRRSETVMADIRTDEEVTAFAETLLQAVAAVTADPKSELHLSLAGGRKTMSFLAGAVLSFHGRPKDRLSHVLVEPADYESANLWWPGQPEPVTTRSGTRLDPASARVLLHDVPYVRLAPWLAAENLFAVGGPSGYAEAVRRANEALAVDTLTIDLERRQVWVGARAFAGKGFEPRGLAALALVAVARKNGQTLTYTKCKEEPDAKVVALDGDIARAARLFGVIHTLLTAAEGDAPVDLAEIATNPGVRAAFEQQVRQASLWLYSEDFSTLVSRVRNRLRTSLGANTAKRILPRGLALGLPPENIRLIPPAGLDIGVLAPLLEG